MITVLFFAHLQDAVGQEKVMMDKAPISIIELKKELAALYSLPNLDNVMFAINEEYATGEDLVKDGDTVALIPPVSGG
ncbi:molybdopterin converting factor subunit 1 [Cytobacillus suaedae]|nr:molybdopterin converting factor subunit 1 [Cytobacillus suaedae]